MTEYIPFIASPWNHPNTSVKLGLRAPEPPALDPDSAPPPAAEAPPLRAAPTADTPVAMRAAPAMPAAT